MTKDDAIPSFDPMKAWREWVVKNEREWSESMSRVLQDTTVAHAMGQGANAQAYQQKLLSDAMATPMAAMNMPTRNDIVALSDRVGQLEDAVARVEALLVQMKGGATNVPRTRRAPKAKPAASS